MSVDFATLALRVENAEANRNLDATGQKIESVEKKAKSLSVTVEQSRQAWARSGGDMTKFGQELQKMAGAQQVVTVATQASTVAATSSTASLGKLRGAMQALAASALQTAPGVAALGGAVGAFGLGAPEMIGVLAGVAALGFAWNKLTEDTKKANEETKKAIDLLTDLRRKKLLGAGGETGAAVERVRLFELPQAILSLDQLKAGAATTDPYSVAGLKAAADIKVQQGYVAKLRAIVSDGDAAVAQAKQDAADEAARKLEERLNKEFNTWKEGINRINELGKQVKDPLTVMLERADAEQSNIRDMGKLGIAGPSTMRIGGATAAGQIGTSVFASLTVLANRSADAVKDAAALAVVLKKLSDDDKIAQQRANAGGMALNTLSAYGGRAGGITASTVSGFQSGGLWGAAIGGGMALTDTIIHLGRASKEAALQVQAMKDSVQDTILSWRAELGLPGADKALGESRIHQQAKAAREALEQAFPTPFADMHGGNVGKAMQAAGRGEEYQKQLDEINRLEKQRIDALGKEKKAIDDLTHSMVNMVEGYRLQSTIFHAARPRGPVTGRPTIPDRVRGALGHVIGDGGDLTVNVTIDGAVIGSTVVKNLRKKAQAMFGDSTRWPEVQS